jgi:hypothetical protein
MSDKSLEIFKNAAATNPELLKTLQTMDDNLGASTYGTSRRISIRGGKFRQIINGEQVKVAKGDSMNLIVIDAAPVARTYYEGAYDPEKVSPPTCWSADTTSPAPDVAPDNKQASRCADCPQNIKGSGTGNSRACRYSQRLAVVAEGAMDEVYQLQLPATSIFGEAKEGAMPMQGYARFLKAHNTPVIALVTKLRFDEDADVPKLFFSAERSLNETELNKAVEMREHEDTKNAVTFKVFDMDKGENTDRPAPVAGQRIEISVPTLTENEAPKSKKKKDKKKKKAKAQEEAPVQVDNVVTLAPEELDVIEEPVKSDRKSNPVEPPQDDGKLADLVSGWDD